MSKRPRLPVKWSTGRLCPLMAPAVMGPFPSVSIVLWVAGHTTLFSCLRAVAVHLHS